MGYNDKVKLMFDLLSKNTNNGKFKWYKSRENITDDIISSFYLIKDNYKFISILYKLNNYIDHSLIVKKIIENEYQIFKLNNLGRELHNSISYEVNDIEKFIKSIIKK